MKTENVITLPSHVALSNLDSLMVWLRSGRRQRVIVRSLFLRYLFVSTSGMYIQVCILTPKYSNIISHTALRIFQGSSSWNASSLTRACSRWGLKHTMWSIVLGSRCLNSNCFDDGFQSNMPRQSRKKLRATYVELPLDILKTKYDPKWIDEKVASCQALIFYALNPADRS